MSTMEWMQKFQEIGQKGDEEVTAVGESGFVKVAVARQESLKGMGLIGNLDDGGTTPATSIAVKDEDEDDYEEDEDVGALFRAIGAGGNNSTHTGRSVKSQDPPEGSSASNPRSSETVGSDFAVTKDDSTQGGQSSADGIPRENFSNANTEEKENESNSNNNNDDDGGFGESWVVDRDRLGENNNNNKSVAGDQSYMEEVIVDDYGNEILVDENGNEISREEVLLDENGNEIVPNAGPDVFEPANYVQQLQQQQQGLGLGSGLQQPYTRSSDFRQQQGRVYDIEDQKRILGAGTNKGRNSRMSWLIPVLVLAIVLAAVLSVLFLVVYNEDGPLAPIPASSPTPFKPLGPDPSGGVGIDAAATTEFDALRGDCDFSGLVQPNVLDQCRCGSRTVDIIADDVRDRWGFLVDTFTTKVYQEWKDPIDSCSHENQALLWLSSGVNNGGEVDTLLRLQRYVLALIYYQQGGTEWDRSENWLSGENACAWEGIQCNNNNYVRIINLDHNGLTGRLSSAPTLLNEIEDYYVAHNELVGSIPADFFNDNSLMYIDFSGNRLSGEFNKDINPKSKLVDIRVASNKLSGMFPRQIRKIAGLSVLNLENNDFTGNLPGALFNLKLTELAIGGNNFNGTLPLRLPDTQTLTSLSLGPNLFTGEIPTSLNKLTKLEKLSIVGLPGLVGRLPASYGLFLTKLVEFTVSDTGVEGDIPDQFSMMTNLETLRLTNNSIRGRIPLTLDAMTSLRNIHLNGNFMTGTIPSEIGSLSSLEELQLHQNSLHGTIPDSFEQLLNIKTLTFYENYFDGRAPSGLCALREADLNKFIVDCPNLVGENQVSGILCSIPSCCTHCV